MQKIDWFVFCFAHNLYKSLPATSTNSSCSINDTQSHCFFILVITDHVLHVTTFSTILVESKLLKNDLILLIT